MIPYIFLALFFIASVIHLIDSWRDLPKRRRITKPMLLFFLMLYYVFSADKISWVLMAALITSWLGDILLIPDGNAWFVSGGISFLISHILFVAVYVPNIDFAGIKWYIVIPVFLVYLGVALKVIMAVRNNAPKIMLIPLYLYLIANSTMNAFALMQLMSRPCAGSIMAFIGAVLFFSSDCSLFLCDFHENKNLVFKKHFTVMLTYLAGECLITAGMLLIK